MRTQLLLLFVLLISSCKSPRELLEAGNYKSAFKMAVSELKRDNNVTENISVIKQAAEIKVNEALTYITIKAESENVEDWVETQTKVYTLLKDLGNANLLTGGSISEPYDLLCTEKKEIDFQIVDYYFDEGHNHLDRFYHNGQKKDARNAYYSFKNCEKYEGQNFFLNLEEDLEDAYQNGIVYYVSNYGKIGHKLFLQPLPREATFLPDCDIYIDQGMVSFSKSASTDSKSYSKEIETGKKTVIDTSGKRTYEPIYTTIHATVNKTKVTITAHVTTYIKVKNVSGQCTVKSRQFTTSSSDSYTEVSIDGDSNALDHHVSEKNGSTSSLKGDLHSKVINKADRTLGI